MYEFIETQNGGVKMANGQSLADFCAKLPAGEQASFKAELKTFREVLERKQQESETQQDRELFDGAFPYLDETMKSVAEKLLPFWGKSVNLRVINPDATVGEETVTISKLMAVDHNGHAISSYFEGNPAVSFVVVTDEGKVSYRKIIAINSEVL